MPAKVIQRRDPIVPVFFSPLRYPGGKRKLASFIAAIIEKNNLSDGHYVEPFAGGAAVAMELLLKEYVRAVHLNDISLSIFAFWHSVLKETDGLCKLVHDTKVDMKEWSRQLTIQRAFNEYSLLELGFSTFFLNRTNRSGIIKGGVIGGQSQEGHWKIGARYNKDELIARIQRIARRKSRIYLHRKDASAFLAEVSRTLPPGTIFFLDPPYYIKGKDLYEDHYQPSDHRALAKLVVSTLARRWVVSYDHCPEIMAIYNKQRHLIYGINYSAADRYRGREVMFFSDDLTIPPISNPARYRAA